ASRDNNELSNILQMADIYGISKNHLTKVIYHRGKCGYVETIRGRNGRIRLGKSPESMNIGEDVRYAEEDLVRVECF
ncbi:Rrf2 family transcriptional regulator, partial [Bacillus sp. SIMBA_161]